MPNTTLYAAVVGGLVIALGLHVIALRRRHGVSLGDGDRSDLRNAIRAHGNLVEYAPIALILLAGLELAQAPAWLVHTLGATLVVGRILHALSMTRGGPAGRTIGTTLTYTVLGLLVVADLYYVLT